MLDWNIHSSTCWRLCAPTLLFFILQRRWNSLGIVYIEKNPPFKETLSPIGMPLCIPFFIHHFRTPPLVRCTKSKSIHTCTKKGGMVYIVHMFKHFDSLIIFHLFFLIMCKLVKTGCVVKIYNNWLWWLILLCTSGAILFYT